MDMNYNRNEAVPVESVPDNPSLAPTDPEERARYQRELAALFGDSLNMPEEIASLAKLDLTQYAVCRKAEAERLGLSVTWLDKIVAKERRNGDVATDAQGKPIELVVPEPWPDPVDGVEILDGLVALCDRHLLLQPGSVEGIALWIVHAYAHDLATVSPILGVTSPQKRCGKSTLLRLLRQVCAKSLPTSQTSSSALFRLTEKYRPVVLLDEADTFLSTAQGGDNEELRGLLNSGHVKDSAFILRNVKVGDDFEPRMFSTWSPKAIALIGRLPDTLEDRSITIAMRRRAAHERRPEPVRADRSIAGDLPRKLVRWVNDHANALRHAEPDVPEELHDRAQDNWRPLLAIADLAGGRWPVKARAAAKLLTPGTDDEDTRPLELLRDIREIFDTLDCEKIFSEDLVSELNGKEETPWREYRNGNGITDVRLKNMLKPFGVAPERVRIGGDRKRGYEREWFGDAFSRYTPDAKCPSVPPPVKMGPTANFKVSQGDGGGTLQNVRKAPENGDRDTWTLQNTGLGGNLHDKDEKQLPEGIEGLNCFYCTHHEKGHCHAHDKPVSASLADDCDRVLFRKPGENNS